ncbi:MAG: TIGR04552 family protein [Deltaproteobacteria bacterium]|nr:TIGR04552 family protein [Deltaproteobacteria bacterium]
MRSDPLDLDDSIPAAAEQTPLTALDEDTIRLALAGGSVVEWSRLNFRSHDEVNGFLRLWGCDLVEQGWARERLRYLYNQAVEYLEEHVQLHFASEVRRPRDVRDAFLRASMRDRFSRYRIQYCAILKLVHVINHLEMQELRYQVAVREHDLIELANAKVLAAARRMREEGHPVLAFYGNRKTRPSVITKLLAKRESTAATVFDKLRFRVVTETRRDLVSTIGWLFRNLLPFPAVIPGESHNNLLTENELAAIQGVAAVPGLAPAPENPHTSGFRAINFVAGLPVRVYDLPRINTPKNRALLGEVVSVLTEFQVVDRATDVANETGESRHDLYKLRQMQRVYERLGRTMKAPVDGV